MDGERRERANARCVIPTAPRPMEIREGIERNLVEIVANMAVVAGLENGT